MFVRNNTLCPTCGKSSTFDVYVKALLTRDHLAFRVECSNCMAFWDLEVSTAMVRYLLQDAIQLHPTEADLFGVCRWKLHDVYRFLSLGQVRAVQREAVLVFDQGSVAGWALRLPPQSFCHLIGWAIGDRGHHAAFAAMDSLFNVCSWRVVQPLAS